MNETTYDERPCDFIELITIWDERDKAVGSYRWNVGARSVGCRTPSGSNACRYAVPNGVKQPLDPLLRQVRPQLLQLPLQIPQVVTGTESPSNVIPHVFNDGEVRGSCWPREDLNML